MAEAFTCSSCNRFAFSEPEALCWWCQHPMTERRRAACIRLGIRQARSKVRPVHEVEDKWEEARKKLHKKRRKKGG